jgi:hypothetical protein
MTALQAEAVIDFIPYSHIISDRLHNEDGWFARSRIMSVKLSAKSSIFILDSVFFRVASGTVACQRGQIWRLSEEPKDEKLTDYLYPQNILRGKLLRQEIDGLQFYCVGLELGILSEFLGEDVEFQSDPKFSFTSISDFQSCSRFQCFQELTAFHHSFLAFLKSQIGEGELPGSITLLTCWELERLIVAYVSDGCIIPQYEWWVKYFPIESVFSRKVQQFVDSAKLDNLSEAEVIRMAKMLQWFLSDSRKDTILLERKEKTEKLESDSDGDESVGEGSDASRGVEYLEESSECGIGIDPEKIVGDSVSSNLSGRADLHLESMSSTTDRPQKRQRVDVEIQPVHRLCVELMRQYCREPLDSLGHLSWAEQEFPMKNYRNPLYRANGDRFVSLAVVQGGVPLAISCDNMSRIVSDRMAHEDGPTKLVSRHPPLVENAFLCDAIIENFAMFFQAIHPSDFQFHSTLTFQKFCEITTERKTDALVELSLSEAVDNFRLLDLSKQYFAKFFGKSTFYFINFGQFHWVGVAAFFPKNVEGGVQPEPIFVGYDLLNGSTTAIRNAVSNVKR